MRQIKFRAWDKAGKCFVKKVEIDRIPTKNTREGFRLITKFDLDQYVGFKDVNGKPVYENDILEWFYKKKDGEVFRGVVRFGRHSAGSDSWDQELYTVGFFLEFSDNGTTAISQDRQYEVIGNVHENPDLLKP